MGNAKIVCECLDCGHPAVVRYCSTNYCALCAEDSILALVKRINALSAVLAAAALSFPPNMAKGFRAQIQLNSAVVAAMAPFEEPE